ncbi:hypothetical protein BpHYR1_010364 [Brachionus plicatilis]|uniref:Uncharacterized protein n=1 Tax=Brachionus plicatilis TaxID=10195 RepID=A0A3M7RIQ8_BRAPC|nr:hypothetical protein BpHYR1_010364 [Brachionus plicatilis]
MRQSSFGSQSILGSKYQKSFEQIETLIIQLRIMQTQVLALPIGKSWLKVWQLAYSWPHLFIRKYSGYAPNVDFCRVVFAPKQNLRCSIPQSDHFMSECSHWDTKRSC